jgi:hypothetical protein
LHLTRCFKTRANYAFPENKTPHFALVKTRGIDVVVVVVVVIVVVCIIIIVQDIYTYIPEINYVPRDYIVAAIL